MRAAALLILAFTAILPARAAVLTFSISNTPQTGDIFTFASSVIFDGTLTFNSSADTCDSVGADCLYLNAIALDPSTTLPGFLSLDADPFFFNVDGSLSDDGVFNTLSGEIFGISIHPDALSGAYSGTVDILGALDDQSDVTSVLATADFTVVVVPEPAAWGLGILGLAAITWARRVAG